MKTRSSRHNASTSSSIKPASKAGAKAAGRSASRARSKKTVQGLPELPRHYQHAAVVGEIHSRPFPEYPANRVILHFAFMAESGSSVARAAFAELCRLRGETVPSSEMRYHDIAWGRGALRWESHNEFSSFTFDAPAPSRFLAAIDDHPFGADFSPPGTLIAAARVEVRPNTPANRKLLDRFDPESLAVNVLADGKSLLATDFRQDAHGMTVFLLLESRLSPSQIGAYSKTVTELETYRTLAMLGLPLARGLSGKLGRMEADLSRLTSEMKDASADTAAELLAKINTIAAELENDAAASLFRFGASRAYGGIVEDRIAAIGNEPMPGHITLGAYLNRSIPPALRTCESVAGRQDNLSRKLARIADLLRTKVEVEIESQNRNLLASMNRRTHLQLRLQQTVEGLSVAAVSYYVVGLIFYLAQALEKFLPTGLTPKTVAGVFVPVVVLGIWLLVRNVRKHHAEKDEHGDS